jgi:hypothetical protein
LIIIIRGGGFSGVVMGISGVGGLIGLLGVSSEGLTELCLMGFLTGMLPVSLVILTSDSLHVEIGPWLFSLTGRKEILETIRETLVVLVAQSLITPLNTCSMAHKLDIISQNPVGGLHTEGIQCLCSLNLEISNPKGIPEFLDKLHPASGPSFMHTVILLEFDCHVKPLESGFGQEGHSEVDLRRISLEVCGVSAKVEAALEKKLGKFLGVIASKQIRQMGFSTGRGRTTLWLGSQCFSDAVERISETTLIRFFGTRIGDRAWWQSRWAWRRSSGWRPSWRRWSCRRRSWRRRWQWLSSPLFVVPLRILFRRVIIPVFIIITTIITIVIVITTIIWRWRRGSSYDIETARN